MADQEIGILIKAQEQTTAAFTAARGELQKLGQQGQQTNKLLGGLTSGLGALGVAFSATAVIGFAKDILDTAGNINDLSQAMGVSTDAVQDFKSVAEQSGATIDNVGDAINKLNVEAGNGSGGFAKLGLSLEKIQALSPEDRFREVADALQQIKDPAERAALGQELLGKGYKTLAASIDQGIGSMRDANKMTKETIDTLDWLGDSLLSVATKAKNFGGTVIANAVNAPRDLIRSMTADLDRLGIAIDAVAAKAPKIPDAFKGLSRESITPKGLNADEIGQIEEALNKERKALDETAKAADTHAKKIREVQDALFGRTAIAAANDYLAALGSINNLSKVSDEGQKKLNAAALDAIEAYKRLGQTAPAALNQLYVRTVPLPDITERLVDVVKDLGTEAQIAIPILYDLPKPIDDTAAALKLLESYGIRSSLTLKELLPAAAQQAVTAIGQIKDGLRNTLSDIPDLVVASFTGNGSLEGALKSIASRIGRTVGAALGEAIGGPLGAQIGGAVGSLAGSAVKAVEGLIGKISELPTAAKIAFAALVPVLGIPALFADRGRDAVEKFAESLGGFDALHQQLLALGDEGEQLWITLTQGVGKNNPQQAQAAIDAVTKALEKQKEQQGQVGDVTEESALVTIETATQASQALDLVGEKLETSIGQWSDWADSVMNDIARVAASVGGVMVPEPPDTAAVPGFAGGTHGAYLDFGAGTPVMLHGKERVVTEQEGRNGGGGDVYVYIGNEQLDARMVRVARKDAATGGLRTRATTGRSY
jgi:hypothetical protein